MFIDYQCLLWGQEMDKYREGDVVKLKDGRLFVIETIDHEKCKLALRSKESTVLVDFDRVSRYFRGVNQNELLEDSKRYE